MFKCETHIKQFNATSENNIFFVSDTHFNHGNILNYCKRPYETVEQMNEDLIKRWNSVVKPNDTVFHLGDFMFGNIGRFWDFRSRLNGKIYLIHGNHDYKLMCEGNIEEGFEDICSQMNIVVNGQKIYLSHFPFLAFDGIYKEKPSWQLFGHVHSNKDYLYSSPDISRLTYLLPMQYDVGVDNNNYTPVSFEQVKEIINKQILKNA